MADILTPEEDDYFKKTLSMYMAIAKNKNVELSPQLRLDNMIKMFELYLSEVGRVFLNQPLAKNMRNIILKKIAEFRESIVAKENAYFMGLMDDAAILLNNIQVGENIANEEAAQAYFEAEAAQAQAAGQAQAAAQAQAEAQAAWDQIIAEEHALAAQEWAEEWGAQAGQAQEWGQAGQAQEWGQAGQAQEWGQSGEAEEWGQEGEEEEWAQEWAAQAEEQAQAGEAQEWGQAGEQAQAAQAGEQAQAHAEDLLNYEFDANNLFRPALMAIPNVENELLRRREEQRERRQLRREYKYDEM